MYKTLVWKTAKYGTKCSAETQHHCKKKKIQCIIYLMNITIYTYIFLVSNNVEHIFVVFICSHKTTNTSGLQSQNHEIRCTFGIPSNILGCSFTKTPTWVVVSQRHQPFQFQVLNLYVPICQMLQRPCLPIQRSLRHMFSVDLYPTPSIPL